MAERTTFVNTVNPLLSPPMGLIFSSTFEGGGVGRRREGGLFNQVKRTNETMFLEDGLVVPGRYTLFSKYKRMVTILRRELERKVEKVKLIKLEVMRGRRPKTISISSLNKP